MPLCQAQPDLQGLTIHRVFVSAPVARRRSLFTHGRRRTHVTAARHTSCWWRPCSNKSSGPAAGRRVHGSFGERRWDV
jgi:hypothetical protein